MYVLLDAIVCVNFARMMEDEPERLLEVCGQVKLELLSGFYMSVGLYEVICDSEYSVVYNGRIRFCELFDNQSLFSYFCLCVELCVVRPSK